MIKLDIEKEMGCNVICINYVSLYINMITMFVAEYNDAVMRRHKWIWQNSEEWEVFVPELIIVCFSELM